MRLTKFSTKCTEHGKQIRKLTKLTLYSPSEWLQLVDTVCLQA